MTMQKTASRAMLGIGAVAVTLSATGAAYQKIATERDRRKHLAPGRMVDAGGVRLHMVEEGEGSPTVVLEAGLTSMAAQWAWVQPEVAKFARVITYDRAGLGWSEGCPAQRDAEGTARRLRTMLENAGVAGPFVIVGHSLGGLFARMFAHLYRDEVAGLVLVDSVHPEQRRRFGVAGQAEHTGFFLQLALAPWLGCLGLLRLTGFRSHMTEGLPQRAADWFRAFSCMNRHLFSTRDEALAFDVMCKQVGDCGSLGDLPLAVVAAGQWERGWTEQWHILQREIAQISSQSTLRIVPGSTHASLITNREHAQATIETIREMVERARGSSVLAA